MGNCQAAEAATVVIQHPGNKIERIYWSVSAHEIMNSNPGHYVALVVTSPTTRTENGLPLKQLKLLRPDDTLLIGHVYRLVSFEDVLKEFAAKKCVKLGKLLKESRGLGGEMKRKNSSDLLNPISNSDNSNSIKVEQEVNRLGSNGGSTSSSSSRGGGVGMHYGVGAGGGGQWKPALQSISETGT
ncbi:hypothetical protein POPTR_007G005600v4 [Populus trichocarpa]|uniref:DUF4228 domain-containing protein n=1 Tax=Populus trichocarpa TaxID=3694 RepID=B9HG01_POPTR|nr:uncharacterized protein LOC7465560 [Populus trichocarpa]XP_052310628.1 uncharacterized protein LOC7465560 [Populus trichocarpa]PNT26284.1 hypothetical protein POPTR_007G005600v4 [Populus trichocarpa]|eukprot:XP_002310335.1 uncharacterized protein LOC7465560 [Populus trichocarpa]